MSHELIRQALAQALGDLGVQDAEIRLERPRDPTHGDVASNVALTVASQLKRSPREIAEELARRVMDAYGDSLSIEVAGPGFLNFHLSTSEIAESLRAISSADRGFGRSEEGGGRPIMVEFVSANPTGPLHLGHGRQAALGDGISSLLEWTGWKVHREYYYNDTGGQIDRLTASVHARYLQHFGLDAAVPEDGYQGEYVAEIAESLAQEVGELYLDDHSPGALASIKNFAVQLLRRDQDADLDHFGVRFDHYFLESSLYEDGLVDKTREALQATGLVYDLDGAVWLRTTQFGDQKDRVMIKSDGSPTYFLPDVAYHITKWERGFQNAINVQGSDHHGTMARVHAGLQALDFPVAYPEYVLHQMVSVEQDGKEVKFSKRAGSYTTLRELCEAVGAHVVRYFFQMRKPEGHLVFDLSVALDQSEKNPVYKIQYAHARMCSIFRKAGLDRENYRGEEADLSLLEQSAERELIQHLAEFPALVERAALARAPHLVSDYLEQTAGAVNSWYHAGNPSRNPELAVLVQDESLRAARLLLARSIQIVLRNGLEILGVEAPERMERNEEHDAT